MKVVLMKVVFDENVFDEIDHFHPNFDESVPNRTALCRTALRRTAQNFALFFFPPPATISFFFLSIGVLSLNFVGVFEGRGPEMCTFGLSRAVM